MKECVINKTTDIEEGLKQGKSNVVRHQTGHNSTSSPIKWSKADRATEQTVEVERVLNNGPITRTTKT